MTGEARASDLVEHTAERLAGARWRSSRWHAI
jgi:hypothetical protein